MAMVLTEPLTPLQPRQVPVPRPKSGELLVKVEACAVCRTDLHVVDGELPEPEIASNTRTRNRGDGLPV